MFWNLYKSSRRIGLYFLLLGVLCVLIVIDAEDSSFQDCGRVFRGYSLNKGKKAGIFKRLSRTNSHEKCVKDCCNDKDCQTALFVGKLQACYSVDCETDDACRPVRASKNSLKYDLTIFKKEIKGNDDGDSSFSSFSLADDPNRPLIREKRHKSCHHYHGTQSGCKLYLKNKLLYFNRPPVQVEKSLIAPIKSLKQKLSQSCLKYAIAAVCHYAFPFCTDRSQPTPMFLCKEDCHNLYEGVCKNDFKVVTDEEHGFLPDCKTLPSSTQSKCIKLGVPEPLEVSPSQAPSQLQDKQHKDTTETKDEDEDDLNLFKQQINKKTDASTGQTSQTGLTSQTGQTSQTDQTSQTGKTSQTDQTSQTGHTLTEKQTTVNDNNLDTPKQTDSDLNSKIIQQPSVRPSISTTTERKTSNDDSEEDLNTPKRSKSDDDDTEESTDEKISPTVRPVKEGLPKTTSSPTTVPSKDLHVGLGLKKSLNLLEPTASATTETSKASLPTASKASLPTASKASLPTAASPTASKHHVQPTFVNVSKLSNDDVNLDVTDKPTERKSISASNNVTPRPQLNQSTSSVVTSPVPTKKSLGSAKSTLASTSPSKGPTEPSIATKKPSMKTTEAPPTLQVSAGRNKILTLPTNSIELYASAFPKETAGNPYAYHWQQISAPQDSHGYMEGKDTRRVILTKLSHVGVYQFKVSVKGTTNSAFGYAFVNVTVKPVPRINKPPRADISPKEQVITLPTNEVVLDGSKSSDDDKIVQYKWEEVKGPLNDKNKVISSGGDSPVLQLKSLVPGIYTFKLTVIDSDGEQDSTTATVTVNDEKDYPPVARAGNDAVLTLPVNHVTLNGNSSTDNKGIVSYEWSKAPSSPAVGDMQGTNSPFLKVSNMVVGDYTFILKVTDTGGLSSTSKVTVVVQPEKNMPPVAKAGSDKDLVYPDDSTTLDATESHDDQKIVKYHWDQESGPSKAEISGVDGKIATVKKLQEGHYVFKLTVTDDKGLTGTDTVAVSVKKDINKAPVAHAGPDVVVHLPNRAAELDGSKSSDDHGIATYLWLRDPKSPAAGDVINKSDHQAILRLSNLVEGMYKFKLTVMDAKGLKSSDEALLTVKEDENSAHLVELYLDVDITRFTEENKGQLIRKLAVILDVQDDDIVVSHLKEAGTGHSMMVMFYVKGGSMAKDGQAVAEMLKAKIENEEGFFEFRMLKVEPYICRNNCSFHGYCDRRTKLCVCESFWMQDIFKSSFGVKESNCDWSILYVTVIIFGIVMAIGGIIWAICFCLGRISRRRRRLLDDKVVSVDPPIFSDSTAGESSGRRSGRSRRRHRYAIIDEDDDDKAESMEMLPKHKYSSLTLTDSDEDSDETTLFEAKKRLPNGSLNGSIGRKAM